ncbi:MAG: M23 family metallopeptidase [Bacteroidetes bacterium]|nr:M23 family metallopeptidase [Bacteroidota bacterium]MBU1680101.1 M23 family metallopeptidase [Bacteroidota bacterium]
MRALLLIIVFSLSTNIISQTWPYGSDANNDVSSAFGARLWGGYNFHEGIDISGSRNTDVTVVKDGLVVHLGSQGQTDENVKVLNDDGYYSLYIHIDQESNLIENQTIVSEGQTIVGTILVDHLHLEYRSEMLDKSTSYHALNDLPYTNVSNTISITDSEIKSDTYGNYVEIQVSSLKSDLDVCFVGITADGSTEEGFSFDEFEIFKENWVDFEDKENCMDEPLDGQNELDNDGRLFNYNNECALQIVTQSFNHNTSVPQLLKFKFYINDDYLDGGWYELSQLTAYVEFWDAQFNQSFSVPVVIISHPVGVEDDIIFYPGVIVGGQLIESIFETNTIYLPGGDAYILNFVDADYSGTYVNSWDNWKCYASYGCGEVLIMNSQSFNIPSLPDGYNWERDGNGNVIARMEIGGTDSDGFHHTASADIKISGVTTNFITSGTLTSNTTWCGDLTITGNIVIPIGKQLTILTNSNITFANNSCMIVEGILVCEYDDNRVSVLDFVSQNSTLKNGIKINPGGFANINVTTQQPHKL